MVKKVRNIISHAKVFNMACKYGMHGINFITINNEMYIIREIIGIIGRRENNKKKIILFSYLGSRYLFIFPYNTDK